MDQNVTPRSNSVFCANSVRKQTGMSINMVNLYHTICTCMWREDWLQLDLSMQQFTVAIG